MQNTHRRLGRLAKCDSCGIGAAVEFLHHGVSARVALSLLLGAFSYRVSVLLAIEAPSFGLDFQELGGRKPVANYMAWSFMNAAT